MRLWFLVGLVFVLSNLWTVAPAQKPELRDLNVDFMLRGYFYAGSRIKDEKALGGFGTSKNFPKSFGSKRFSPGKISLVAYPDEETAFYKEFRGMKLILANSTSRRQAFAASDSRLNIVQEAKDKDGEWKPVEYLPSSWCGNSYHTVFLDPGEYWEFAAARFTGEQKTMLRFRLDLRRGDQPKYIYSNEFEGSINPKQFTVQKPYTPQGIMDPYDN